MSEWNIALWNWNFLIVVFFMFTAICLGVKMGFLDGVLRALGDGQSYVRNKMIALGMTVLFVAVIMGAGYLALLVTWME